MNYNLEIGEYNDILRYELINSLIRKNHYKSYLEIGVSYGESFNNIVCDEKVGVDPDPNSAATVYMTSDDYFAHIPDDKKFDMIFIDGFHEWHTCYRDIVNSIRHLSPNGTIVCHDMNPICEVWIDIDNLNRGGAWTGDVFKTLVEIRSTRNDVEAALLFDTDMGIGIIRHKQLSNPPVSCDIDNLTYEEWVSNKQYLSGCIPYEVFEQNFLHDDYFLHNLAEFN